MKTGPHEMLALRVLALSLAAGLGVWYGSQRSAPALRLEDGGGAAEGPGEVGRLIESAAQEGARSRRRATRLAPDERIDPNTADVDELQRLPRVGPALAQRIIDHRTAHGPFRSLADLDAVPGVGPALLAGITPHVELPAAPAGAVAAAPVAAAPGQGSTAESRRVPQPHTATGIAAGELGSRSGAAQGPVSPNPAHPLDLNAASAAELERLPGIGPALAARIVGWREAHGPFRSVADLQKVSGIGPRTVERLAPLVRAGPGQ